MQYPQLIQNLINSFSKLPGIGPKSAERIVFYILNNKQFLTSIAENSSFAIKNIIKCNICFNFTTKDKNPCPVCSNPKRNQEKIIVVEKPQDIPVIEKTKFDGVYHILGGLINPAHGVTPDTLNIDSLVERTKKNKNTEVILVFDSSIEGETTILYISKILKKHNIKISKPARGLPIGADIEYADEITLYEALKKRETIES